MTEETRNVPDVTRVEVISENGREYVNLKCRNVQIAMQDEGKTLKIFLNLPLNRT